MFTIISPSLCFFNEKALEKTFYLCYHNFRYIEKRADRESKGAVFS